MISFSLPGVKKDTIFGAAQTKLGPSYFVRSLVLGEFGSFYCLLILNVQRIFLDGATRFHSFIPNCNSVEIV